VSAGTFQLRRRLQVALEGLAAIAGTLVVGALGALVLGALALGVLLSVVWIGLPLVIGALAACQTLAEVHRRQANRLLGAHVPPLPALERRGETLWRRSLHALSDRRRWRIVGVVALDLPVGAALLVAAIAPVALTLELLVLGLGAIAGVGDAEFLGPLSLGPPVGVLLLVLAAACAVLTVAILGALRLAVRGYTRAILGRRSGDEGPIRELLAERVGDRTLSGVLARRPGDVRRRVRSPRRAAGSGLGARLDRGRP